MRFGRKQIKKVGRTTLRYSGQVSKVAIPAVATVASYFVPGSGVLVAAAARPIQRYEQGAVARSKGYSGREARAEARAVVNRTTKYALIGAGVGTVAGLIVPATAAAGGGAASVAAGSGAAGQGATALAGGFTGVGGVTLGTFASAAGSVLTFASPLVGNMFFPTSAAGGGAASVGSGAGFAGQGLGMLGGGGGGDMGGGGGPGGSGARDAQGRPTSGGSLLPLLLIGGLILWAA